MKRKHKTAKKKELFACCICSESIFPTSEACCTLFIERGVPGHKQRPTFEQSIWAHGQCLKKLIPITEYSFPELDASARKQIM